MGKQKSEGNSTKNVKPYFRTLKPQKPRNSDRFNHVLYMHHSDNLAAIELEEAVSKVQEEADTVGDTALGPQWERYTRIAVTRLKQAGFIEITYGDDDSEDLISPTETLRTIFREMPEALEASFPDFDTLSAFEQQRLRQDYLRSKVSPRPISRQEMHILMRQMESNMREKDTRIRELEMQLEAALAAPSSSGHPSNLTSQPEASGSSSGLQALSRQATEVPEGAPCPVEPEVDDAMDAEPAHVQQAPGGPAPLAVLQVPARILSRSATMPVISQTPLRQHDAASFYPTPGSPSRSSRRPAAVAPEFSIASLRTPPATPESRSRTSRSPMPGAFDSEPEGDEDDESMEVDQTLDAGNVSGNDDDDDDAMQVAHSLTHRLMSTTQVVPGAPVQPAAPLTLPCQECPGLKRAVEEQAETIRKRDSEVKGLKVGEKAYQTLIEEMVHNSLEKIKTIIGLKERVAELEGTAVDAPSDDV